MNLQPNSIFAGRYRLIKQIGRGGFSVVWLVADQMTEDTEMALKIYAPDKGMDEGGLNMFRREYTVTAKLNHPGLLKAAHFDIFQGSPYLIMPFCENGSLHSLLMEKGALKEMDIARVLVQVGDALQYLHNENILHQDIKPDNVLIDARGNFLLTDFGISSRLRSTLRKSTNTATSMTVAYAPPERFSAKQRRLPAGDVFSLGIMIYEMATGELPWMGAGGSIMHSNTELPELDPPYSPGLSLLMQQCLSFDPDKRLSAHAVQEAARQYLQTNHWSTTSGPRDSTQRKTVRIEDTKTGSGGKISTWSIAIITTVLILAGIILVFPWMGEDPEKSNAESGEMHTDFVLNENEAMEFLSEYYTAQSNNYQDDYYAGSNRKPADARKYFANHILQYVLAKNLSPDDLNQIWNSETEYVDKFERIVGDVRLVRIEGDLWYFEYWTDFRCWRRSKQQFQLCKIKKEVGFDVNKKIASYRELEIKDLVFKDFKQEPG